MKKANACELRLLRGVDAYVERFIVEQWIVKSSKLIARLFAVVKKKQTIKSIFKAIRASHSDS